MYIFDVDKKEQLLEGRKINYVAEKIGITNSFLVSVLNGNKHCTKPIAYCIVKCLQSDMEVEDFFIKKED